MNNTFGEIYTITKISAGELEKYNEKTPVYISRNLLCTEIVKLQNSVTDENKYKKLFILMESLWFPKKRKNPKFSFKYIELTAKIVLECFPDENISIFVDGTINHE